MVKIARPLASSCAVPTEVVPSKKVALPVGVPVPEVRAVTATSSRGSPCSRVLAEGVRTTEVAAGGCCCTVTMMAEELDGAFVASPPYAAVIECTPTASEPAMSMAEPALFRFALPRTVAPSEKLTEPVGGLAEPLIVAVSVTEVPTPITAAELESVIVVATNVAAGKLADGWMTGQSLLHVTGAAQR